MRWSILADVGRTTTFYTNPALCVIGGVKEIELFACQPVDPGQLMLGKPKDLIKRPILEHKSHDVLNLVSPRESQDGDERASWKQVCKHRAEV